MRQIANLTWRGWRHLASRCTGVQEPYACEHQSEVSLLAAAVQRMGDKIMAYAVLRWVTLVCAPQLRHQLLMPACSTG